MAKKRKEDPPKGAPAWQATFSDLMNLLLCFFVLLFAMSSIDSDKFEQVVASLQSSMSILPAGGSSIGDGQMVSAGVSQLEFMDSYYNDLANSANKNETDSDGSVEAAYDAAGLAESEGMSSDIQQALEEAGLQDMVDVDFTAQYVKINLNGAILFDSGAADLVPDAYPIVDKISRILEKYTNHMIEIEGHTDNIPLSGSGKFESNDILSMYRALSVANYVRSVTSLEPSHIYSSGRGDYDPIADNSTAEGRALNRRVEIKIYNSYNSDFD